MSDLLDRDQRHVWHPFTQAAVAAPPLPVVRAEGAWLELADGRRILDLISSWWTNLHGHGHPRIADAIARQARELDHVLFAGCTHPPAVDVAERLIAMAPGGLSRVFFSDDGSTAVEVALKMALQFHAQVGQPRRRRFVAFENAYHGDTVGAMSMGDRGGFSGAFEPLLFDVQRVPLQLAALRQLLETQGDEMAAVLLEPMLQAAGGMLLQEPALLRGVADLCRQHGALFIADEVMTAFGRMGRMFACEHADVQPDLLCVAKGLSGGVLPLAATLATESIYDAFLHADPRRAFLHGHSFTANPIACAAALANFAIFDEEPVLERIAAIERFYAARLPLLRRHPLVRDVRWLGSLGVVELGDADGYFSASASHAVRDACLQRGLLLRPLGPVLYTLPPYCITTAELSMAYDAMDDVIAGL